MLVRRLQDQRTVVTSHSVCDRARRCAPDFNGFRLIEDLGRHVGINTAKDCMSERGYCDVSDLAVVDLTSESQAKNAQKFGRCTPYFDVITVGYSTLFP